MFINFSLLNTIYKSIKLIHLNGISVQYSNKMYIWIFTQICVFRSTKKNEQNLVLKSSLVSTDLTIVKKYLCKC
jgi:hypothetical protein